MHFLYAVLQFLDLFKKLCVLRKYNFFRQKKVNEGTFSFCVSICNSFALGFYKQGLNS